MNNHADPVHLRIATPADTEKIWELLQLMHLEAPAGTLSEKRVREQIAACFQFGGVMLGEEDGIPVATMGFVPNQWWWSEDWYLQDVWCFTRPGYRGKPYAQQMLEEAKKVAKNLNFDLWVGVFSNDRTKAKARLWSRVFGEPVGAVFLMKA